MKPKLHPTTFADWRGPRLNRPQHRYVYDGMRVIQTRQGNNTPYVSYTRGTDLSGSLEGAGGIGGLLGRSHLYSGGNWYTHNFYHADGNGNVTYLVNSSQGLAASYRYDPYGNLISQSGTLAFANVYRFSSKEIHWNSGFYYYGYRWYAPNLQRWPNRDPLGEPGFEVLRSSGRNDRGIVFAEIEEGPNLFAFVTNDGVNYYDDYGNGKRPARNRDRTGHGSGGDTKGGTRGDKHSRAQGHGGREKPNFTRVDRRGNKVRCVGLLALTLSLEQFADQYGPPIPEDGRCPEPYTAVRHNLIFGFYYYTCELLI